jgi:hypothetical protein
MSGGVCPECGQRTNPQSETHLCVHCRDYEEANSPCDRAEPNVKEDTRPIGAIVEEAESCGCTNCRDLLSRLGER